jgi:tetratricopeptide (TPR) repeat protein
MRLCGTAAQRREVLTFVKEELVRQVTFGDGLLAFRRAAHGTLAPEEMLTALREALRDRPDLWHAWSACIRQLLDVDRRDEAWELACQATDRFPLLPPLWLDRAAACRARQDRQGEREALKTACQINPDWGDAVRALADFHQRQGEFDQTRQLLERAVLRQPLDMNHHIMLAETLWRRGQREAAMERIGRAVEREPRYERAWTDLRTWAAELGRREAAVDVARKLTDTRGGEAQSWLLLAEALGEREPIEERLAALGRAAELEPRLVKAHDLRATALAGARRWDEAREACRPPAWGEHPPVELQGRAAWIEAQRGEPRQAIAAMRSVLAEEPSYYTGWSWLWQWCRQVQDYRGCLAAGEALVRISPQYEISLGYLGEAKRLNNDRPGAYEAFRRAFELNPGYEYAGNALFDLQLADGRLNDAEATLALLQRHSRSAAVGARAVQLAARGRVVAAPAVAATVDGQLASHSAVVGTFQSAAAASIQCTAQISSGGKPRWPSGSAAYYLRQLCTTAWPDGSPLATAVKAMVEAGCKRLAEQVLEESLACDGAHVEIGRQWVRLCLARNRWSCGRRLRELASRGILGIEAAVVYIEGLAKAKHRGRFRLFLWRNKAWLHKNTRTWESVGYAMTCFAQYHRLVRWMTDWRQRNDLESWALANLVEGLRALRRDAEAAEVGRRSLTLAPHHTHAGQRVWLAADAVCEGKIEAARQLLSQVQGAQLSDSFKFLQELTAAVVEMAAAGDAEKAKVFRAVRKRLHQIVARYRAVARGRARRRFYRSCLRLVAQHRGGLAARLWSSACWLTS